MGADGSSKNNKSRVRSDSLNSESYSKFDRLSERDRRAVFNATAQRRFILPTNAEKDFWVCRTLCVLMKSTPSKPKRYFKGGTSLSKGFGLIERFSEDIDVVLSRKGLIGSQHPDPTDPKQALSNSAREKIMSLLRKASREYVYGTLRQNLEFHLPGIIIEEDRSSSAEHVLLISYPSVFPPDASEYNPRRVKIDAGVRGADEPYVDCTVVPYIQDYLKEGFDFGIPRVTMVRPERTFWEKVTAIHNVNSSFTEDNIMPNDRQFVARHYYDVAQISTKPEGKKAIKNTKLLYDVCEYGLHVFPGRSKFNASAKPGLCRIVPADGLIPAIEKDYVGMQGMMFAQPSMPFARIIEQLKLLEETLNALPSE